MAGRCKDRKESLTNGDLCSEADSDSTSRRLSFLKMVGKGKMKRESMQDHSSQGPEEEPVEEVPEVKPREPLSGKQSTSESEAVHLYSSIQQHTHIPQKKDQIYLSITNEIYIIKQFLFYMCFSFYSHKMFSSLAIYNSCFVIVCVNVIQYFWLF